MGDLNRALAEWRRILPADRVLSGDALDGYRVNCHGIIPVVLVPMNQSQVVGIVEIACRHGIPLYRFIGGHDCIVLSCRNRIAHLDRELRPITVEPGVTHGQWFDCLAAETLDCFAPTTGAGPTANILGNAPERGFGMIPADMPLPQGDLALVRPAAATRARTREI